MKAYSIIDRFLLKIFLVSKVLSAVIVALCFLVALVTGLGLLLGGGQSIMVPDFQSIMESLDESNSLHISENENYLALEKRRQIEKKYGDDVTDMIQQWNLPTQAYDVLLSDCIGMGADFRKEFIGGLKDFLNDANKHFTKIEQKENFNSAQVTNVYRELFKQAIAATEESEREHSTQRIYSLGMFIGSIVVLLAFLIIPLLIHIEQNTRREQS